MRNIGWIRCRLQSQIITNQLVIDSHSLLTSIKSVISDLLQVSTPGSFVTYW
jgi:hypothetical protein